MHVRASMNNLLITVWPSHVSGQPREVCILWSLINIFVLYYIICKGDKVSCTRPWDVLVQCSRSCSLYDTLLIFVWWWRWWWWWWWWFSTYTALQAAYASLTALCVTHRVGISLGQSPSPRIRTFACSHTAIRSPSLPFSRNTSDWE